jgi:large-conductance mechanosensitive channel
MKVCTCLNPLHTALAIYGCMLGYTLISEEMKDAQLRRMIDEIGYREGLPVVVNPGVLDPRVFIDTVVNVRLPNVFMPDSPQRIATDTSQKLAIRFGETIKAYQKRPDLNVADLKIELKPGIPEVTDPATGEVVKEAVEAVTWNYGAFCQNVLDFFIIAICLFFIIKAINNRIKSRVDLPAGKNVLCFLMKLITDRFPVCPGSRDQKIQRLLPGIPRSFRQHIVEFPVRLGMNFIENKPGYIQAVLRTDFCG